MHANMHAHLSLSHAFSWSHPRKMSSVSPSISPTLPIQSHFRKPMLPFHTSTATKAFSSLLKMAKVRQTPKPISISAHWVPNYPPDQPSKTPVPPEFAFRPQTDPPSVPSVPPDLPRPPNVLDFDPIPLERPADPPPLLPGLNPGPDFPGPPSPSPPGPDAPRPPIPSPPGPDVPKGPPDVYPPNGPDIVPPTPPEVVPPLHPTQPDIPPPFNPYM